MEISIIMPSYNYGRFITDAIHSLIGGPTSLGEFAPQTFGDFEIIIVDDASQDETHEYARSFLNLPNVSYIRNETNLGTAGALNVGIRQAQGKYITFLSADDMMETPRLQKLHDAIVANPHSCIYDNLMTFTDGQRKTLMPLGIYDFDKLLYKNTMHAGILYPRSAWTEAGGYPENFRDGREDWAFNVALGRVGYCGVRVNEPLYLYRWERQNRSLRNAGVDWRLTFLNKMQTTFPDLYRGERPKMCCGNKTKQALAPQQQQSRASRNSRTASQPLAPDVVIGAEGMTILEYQLTKAGPVAYYGAVTGQTYIFGGKHKLGNVDNRDVPALLARIEDRRHAFAYPKQDKPYIEATQPVKSGGNGKEMVVEPIKEEILPEVTATAQKFPEPTPLESTTEPAKRGKRKSA